MRPDEAAFEVRSLSVVYRRNHLIASHAHEWGQLIYGRTGAMRVEAARTVWLVPPTRAIWIPAGVSHRFDIKSEVALRTLYLSPRLASQLSDEVNGIEVGPLLTALIVQIAAIGTLDMRDERHARLAGVLVDLIDAAPPHDLCLQMPRDRRARSIADRILADLAHTSSLSDMARDSGASIRTLQRCFAKETGIGLDAWRQKARLVAAAATLSSGTSVTHSALECGYDSVSAFIAAFKRTFGVTPARFAKSD